MFRDFFVLIFLSFEQNIVTSHYFSQMAWNSYLYDIISLLCGTEKIWRLSPEKIEPARQQLGP